MSEAQSLPKAHVAINVRSVERSVEFYRRMLGLEPSKHRTGYAKFDLQSPPLNLTLNERPFADSGALFHMGIQVASTEEVLKLRERWAAEGLLTRDEMGIVCGYALQDKTWVVDPDGNEWEVFVVLEDNLTESTSCCTTDAEGQDVCATTGEVVSATAGAASCCAPAPPVTLAR